MTNTSHAPGHAAPVADLVEDGRHVRSGLGLFEMEQLLDWLEARACTCRDVRIDVLKGTVSWQDAHSESIRA